MYKQIIWIEIRIRYFAEKAFNLECENLKSFWKKKCNDDRRNFKSTVSKFFSMQNVMMNLQSIKWKIDWFCHVLILQMKRRLLSSNFNKYELVDLGFWNWKKASESYIFGMKINQPKNDKSLIFIGLDVSMKYVFQANFVKKKT
jgi:hypothetical protein